MQVRLLGPVDVVVDGEVRAVPGARRRAVLAALAVTPGEVVGTDRLIDVVWGADPPATALNTLQRHVSFLRELLGRREAILARPPGYVLAADGDVTDAARAEALVEAAGRLSDPAERVARLRAALALWRGRPLQDVTGLDAGPFEGLWLRAQTALAEDRLQLGEAAAVAADLSRLTAEHPLDERLHGLLMLALYRSGRPADAAAVAARLRERLAAELGLDPGKALREIEAQVHRRDAVPAQLPLAVRGFTGRRDELARLSAASGVCVITGPPGVGKTSLAVHWAQGAADRFPDGQLYANLRGFDPAGPAASPAEVLRGFLGALGLHHLPEDLPELSDLYRTTLAGRRVLVMLDNARDAEQVRPLLSGFSVVTSRNRLDLDAEHIRLPLLDAAEAHELLAARLGAGRVAAEPAAAEEIVARCARLPLALAVAAALAATRPGASLSAQAAQLRTAADTLDALDGGDPATDVRAVFSWSYRALDAAAARLFRLLGLHPGPDLTAPGAASLAGLSVAVARPLLGRLVDANLLAEHTPGRYRQHDLLRSYAAAQATAEEGGPAVVRVLDHHLQTAHAAAMLIDPGRRAAPPVAAQPGVTVPALGEHGRALAWFAANHQVLTAAVRLAADAGLDTHAWQLAWTMTTYLDWEGHWGELITTQFSALDALERLGERPGRAHAHRDLGRTFARLHRYDEASGHLRQALELYGELGDTVGQGRTEHSLGWMRLEQGRRQESLEHSMRAVALFRAAGDVLWQARSLGAAGWLHCELGDPATGLRDCEEALRLMQQAGDRHAEAGNWDSIGFAHHRLGNYAEATRCFERSLTLFDGFGDRASQAEVRIHLGDTLSVQGASGAAVAQWRQALDTLEELGHPAAEQAKERLDAALRPR